MSIRFLKAACPQVWHQLRVHGRREFGFKELNNGGHAYMTVSTHLVRRRQRNGGLNESAHFGLRILLGGNEVYHVIVGDNADQLWHEFVAMLVTFADRVPADLCAHCERAFAWGGTDTCVGCSLAASAGLAVPWDNRRVPALRP